MADSLCCVTSCNESLVLDTHSIVNNTYINVNITYFSNPGVLCMCVNSAGNCGPFSQMTDAIRPPCLPVVLMRARSVAVKCARVLQRFAAGAQFMEPLTANSDWDLTLPQQAMYTCVCVVCLSAVWVSVPVPDSISISVYVFVCRCVYLCVFVCFYSIAGSAGAACITEIGLELTVQRKDHEPNAGLCGC